jgi:hypothetical protein
MVAHTTANGNGAHTSSAIDTTGAKLLVIAVGVYYTGSPCQADSVSDSKSNTWVSVGAYNATGTVAGKVCIWYVANPTVGAGHTFTVNNVYAASEISAWSNVASSPLDVHNGAGSTSNVTSISTGSVTPSQNYELCLAAGSDGVNETTISFASPSAAFTTIDTILNAGGTNIGGADGYQVQTAATAVSTTYTQGGSATGMAATIACFKHQ